MNRKGMVRRAPVMAEVEARIATLDTGIEDESPLIALGLRAGVQPGTIYHLTVRPYERMDFDIADRLLCALGIAHLWWTKLADVYAEVDLSGESRVPRWEPQFKDYVCESESCRKEFRVLTNSALNKKRKERRYCSHSCSQTTNNLKRHVPKPKPNQRPKLYTRPVTA